MFNQLSKQLGLEAELYTESDFTNRSTDLTNNRSGNELFVYLFFDEKCWKKRRIAVFVIFPEFFIILYSCFSMTQTVIHLDLIGIRVLIK